LRAKLIAQLALKHRENKNQRQRIVVFVGSPIAEDKESLIKIGKKLKKNNVAVDVVSFGSEEENAEKLEAFYGAVNSNDNSHLVTVPAGTILSDMLFSTPIFMEESGSGDGGGAAAAPRTNIVDGFDYSELGVDPHLDPELALALRISIEEERARQAAANPGETGPGEGATVGQDVMISTAGPAENLGNAKESDIGAGEGLEAMDEDTLLQQALALSMQTESGDTNAYIGGTPHQETRAGGSASPGAPSKAAEPSTVGGQISSHQIDDMGLMEDDPELALALQMSLAQDQPDENMDDEEAKEE
jgi:26S proteasome regulatory subunit N10